MQRIGYLCGSKSWGGLEMNQWRNARWMKQRGHEVVVFGKEGSQLESYCKKDELTFVAVPDYRKYYDVAAARKLSRLLKANRIDHLIIRDVRDMSVAALAKNWFSHPFKLHYFMEMQLGVSKRNVLHTLRFRQFDTWSCPLHWLEEQVKTKTRMPHDRIIYIPSGLELAPLQQALSKEEARRLLDVPQTGVLIGLAGRFDPQKGQLLLLEAAQQLTDQSFGIVFLGAPTHNEGENYHQTMLDLIESAGLRERVFVRPFRNDINVFYKAIDAFVMASKAETFGMVTIEAMACGTPVVGSNAGGTPELLQFGELGYLFEPLSSDDLAAKLGDFLCNSHLFPSEKLEQAMQLFDHRSVCELVENRLESFR
ncbi:MAG: glycosyltransferase family 4 protein [Fluviicola sp.]|nr:glycosyltransferase family 4 protein [Fluviicola sp.]